MLHILERLNVRANFALKTFLGFDNSRVKAINLPIHFFPSVPESVMPAIFAVDDSEIFIPIYHLGGGVV